LPLITFVEDGTSIAVVAIEIVAFVDAADFRLTRIIRTQVVVVANGRNCSNAATCGTLVDGSTCILVVTLGQVVLEDAATVRFARIVSTRVAIIAHDRLPFACPSLTDITLCTCIPIITGRGIVDVFAACAWVARVVRADVTIIAIHRCPGTALTVNAHVTRRTRITVVTRSLDGDVLATSIRITTVGCTDLVVVAVERFPHAQTLLTGVHLRTDVAVVAGSPTNGKNYALPRLVAPRLGARVIRGVGTLRFS